MRMAILAAAAVLPLAACNSSGTSGGDAGGAATGSGLGSLISVDLSQIRAEVAKNVNVALEDVPITIQLPVSVAANVCGVNVNVLSVQVPTGGSTCTATTSSPTLEQEVRNQIA